MKNIGIRSIKIFGIGALLLMLLVTFTPGVTVQADGVARAVGAGVEIGYISTEVLSGVPDIVKIYKAKVDQNAILDDVTDGEWSGDDDKDNPQEVDDGSNEDSDNENDDEYDDNEDDQDKPDDQDESDEQESDEEDDDEYEGDEDDNEDRLPPCPPAEMPSPPDKDKLPEIPDIDPPFEYWYLGNEAKKDPYGVYQIILIK